MKRSLLKESIDEIRDIVKKYAQSYRQNEEACNDKYHTWLDNHADKLSKLSPDLVDKIKSAVLTRIKEASTSSAAGAYMTPFAFSTRGPGNIRAATQLGYRLAKPVKRSPKYALENQVYSEPAYVTPAQDIGLVSTWEDENGLIQHGDPEMDPGLDGYKQCELPTTETIVKEGIGVSKYMTSEAEIEPDVKVKEKEKVIVKDPQQTPTPSVNVQTYNVLPDFTAFDVKLKNSTEKLKLDLQKKIQDQILNKKVVIRAAKGYKQPEMDYTVNVTGVAIDYYYDRYVIIVVGREENKQKVSKFFLKPGYKIRILGPADVKPKDKYQIAKSQALVDPDASAAGSDNVVTSPEPIARPKEEPVDQPLAEFTFKKHLDQLN